MARYFYTDEDYEDYEDMLDLLKNEKVQIKKPKIKYQEQKTHKTKSDYQKESLPEQDVDFDEINKIFGNLNIEEPKEEKKIQPTTTSITEKKTFVPGEYSQEIKGSTIDFARLADIQPVEQEHNGFITYGIKFLFMGKKGLFRIVWFNRNERLRDQVFAEKTVYWQSVKELLEK